MKNFSPRSCNQQIYVSFAKPMHKWSFMDKIMINKPFRIVFSFPSNLTKKLAEYKFNSPAQFHNFFGSNDILDYQSLTVYILERSVKHTFKLTKIVSTYILFSSFLVIDSNSPLLISAFLFYIKNIQTQKMA
jgi:hypothetical protein